MFLLCVFAGLNVFDSDAGRTDPGAQSSGVQLLSVQPPRGNSAHDNQQIRVTQNQTVSLLGILAPGLTAEQ